MEFKELKDKYIKETIPKNKIEMIDLFSEFIDTHNLSFFVTQYKSESDGKVRAKIIELLANNVPKSSGSILIEALKDNFIETKKVAVIAIGKIKILSALNPLLEMLSNPSLEIRDIVIESIVSIGKLGDVSGIINYYEHGNIHIKRLIPVILGKIQSEDSVNYLKELVHKKDPEVRINTVEALARLLQLKDARLIINLLDDIDIEVKKASIKALGVIKSKRSIDPLLKLLKNKDDEIRKLSIQSLKNIFLTINSYDEIYEIANSKNIVERKEAIKLLGLLQDKKSIDYMIKSFKSELGLQKWLRAFFPE